ncbi:MAG TPA: zinc ribbon domain-containing protein [Anaerolineae bacterium]|nr:zinc ribbon domain-containing protein [Anaerolineae bacterium]
MIGQGRIVGVILVIVGLIIGLAIAAWLLSGLTEGTLRASGFALGLVLALVLVLPLLGSGGYLFIRGTREARAFAEVEREKRILNMVQTQGQIRVAEVALEMHLTLDQVKAYIYDLVGKGLFTGYINWDDGILYARDAKEMRTTKCPNCGGEREVVGKGIVKCPYCGIELFL